MAKKYDYFDSYDGTVSERATGDHVARQLADRFHADQQKFEGDQELLARRARAYAEPSGRAADSAPSNVAVKIAEGILEYNTPAARAERRAAAQKAELEAQEDARLEALQARRERDPRSSADKLVLRSKFPDAML